MNEEKIITTIDRILPTLNRGQLTAYQTVMSGENTFVTGGAGTGKSYLVRALMECFRYYRKNVLLCAPTGMAATNIDGVTVHRAFGFNTSACVNISRKGKISIVAHAPETLKKADVVVIDEISMCRMDMFDAICASIRKAEKEVLKETGHAHKIQLIVIGDMYQLGPILSDKKDKNNQSKLNERELLEKYYGRKIEIPYAFLSNEWKNCNFKTVNLVEIVRQKDEEFIENLNKARVGDESCILYFNTRSSKTYNDYAPHLYSYNADVDQENLYQMDVLMDPTWYTLPVKYDEALTDTDLYGLPSNVVLKIGARVIICCNDDFKGTHAERDPLDLLSQKDGKPGTRFHNGTLGTVEDIKMYPENPEDPDDPNNEYVLVHLDTGERIYFYRRNFNIYDYKVENGVLIKSVVGQYSWIPVKPAYALTIHRAQGQTYEEVNINPNCRNYGQLYVALSRATSIQGIHLDRNIAIYNLRADPIVAEFYAGLTDVVKYKLKPGPKPKQKQPKVLKGATEKGGAPKKYPKGTSVMKVPNEWAGLLKACIEKTYPAPHQENQYFIEEMISAMERLLKK